MLPAPLLSLTGSVSADDEAGPASPTIDENTVYEILSNERRRRCLKLLIDTDDVWEVSRLSERVAADIAGPSGAADDIYDSVYISMCQTHLPKLADADLVAYDADAKTVSIGPTADALGRYWYAAETTADDADEGAPLALLASGCTVLGLGAGLVVPALATPLLVAVLGFNLVVLAAAVGRRVRATDR